MRKFKFLLFFITIFNYCAFSQIDTVSLEIVEVSPRIFLSDKFISENSILDATVSVDEFHQRLTNMQVISRGAFALEPAIQTFTEGQINVTIDGMKVFGACTDKMDPISSYIETSNLQSISLETSGAGIAHGSAIGGSIEYELQIPDTNCNHVYVINGYESNSQSNYHSINANYGFGKTGFLLSSNYKNYNNYIDGNLQEVMFTNFSKVNTHAAFVYNCNQNSKIITHYIFDEAYNVGYAALPMDVSKATAHLFSVDYLKKSQVPYSKTQTIKLYVNSIYHVMDDSQRDSLFMVFNSLNHNYDSVYMTMDMPGWSKTIGGFYESKIVKNRKSAFVLKFDDYMHYSKADMTMYMQNLSYPNEPPMYTETWPANIQNTTGLYAQYRYKKNDSITFVTDIRFDVNFSKVLSEQGLLQLQALYTTLNSDVFYTCLPSVYVKRICVANKKNRFIYGLGYSSRNPTQTERFGFYLYNAKNGYDYIGNPFLKSEKSISLFYTYNYSSKLFKFSTDIYAYKFLDYIFSETVADVHQLNLYAYGTRQYVNNSSSYMLYYSANSLLMLSEKIILHNQVKYSYGKLNSNEYLPYMQPLQVFTAIELTPNKNSKLRTEFIYNAKQNLILENYETKTDSYFLINFIALYQTKIFTLPTTIKTTVFNVANTVYKDHLDWGTYYRQGINLRLEVVLHL